MITSCLSLKSESSRHRKGHLTLEENDQYKRKYEKSSMLSSFSSLTCELAGLQLARAVDERELALRRNLHVSSNLSSPNKDNAYLT